MKGSCAEDSPNPPKVTLGSTGGGGWESMRGEIPIPDASDMDSAVGMLVVLQQAVLPLNFRVSSAFFASSFVL